MSEKKYRKVVIKDAEKKISYKHYENCIGTQLFFQVRTMHRHFTSACAMTLQVLVKWVDT